MKTNRRRSPSRKLRLYVGGESPTSLAAVTTVRALLGDAGGDLEVTDVERRPAAALRDGIFVTPTLILERGSQTIRLVGDFTRGDQLQELLRVGRASGGAGD